MEEKNTQPGCSQAGFMPGIPLIMMVAGILVAVLIPVLPDTGDRILVCAAALVWIAGFYYVLVVPGWLPDNSGKQHPRLNRFIYAILVLFIVAVTLFFILDL